MNTVESLKVGFKKNKYVKVEKFIEDDICALMNNYCVANLVAKPSMINEDLLRGENDNSKTHTVGSDLLMETFLFTYQDKIESIVDLELCPSYSFYRVYKKGDLLKRHIDRPACEISATLTLGFDLGEMPEDEYNWGIFMNGNEVKMHPGDLVIYRGFEVEHYREPFKGAYQAQVFLHYIDKKGPFYPEFKYDQSDEREMTFGKLFS